MTVRGSIWPGPERPRHTPGLTTVAASRPWRNSQADVARRPNPITRNGGGGIRTHGTVARTRRFQRRSFGHSDTPPQETCGGEGGTRTPKRLRAPVFETGALPIRLPLRIGPRTRAAFAKKNLHQLARLVLENARAYLEPMVQRVRRAYLKDRVHGPGPNIRRPVDEP